MTKQTGGIPPLSQLVASVREDWVTHRRDWTNPGFRALAVYRLGSWHRGFRGRNLGVRIARRGIRMVYGILYRFIRNHYGINIPASAQIGRRLRIVNHGGIFIHKRATVGDDCLIRQGVVIGAAADFGAEAPPRIGDKVEMGVGAMVLGPISVADGAQIGPGAIVMMDVPAGATAFANPARVVFPPRPADEGPPTKSSPNPES